jgi:hypothetical protein
MKYEFTSEENSDLGWGPYPVTIGTETHYGWFCRVYQSQDFDSLREDILIKVDRFNYHDKESKEYYADDYYMYCIYQFLRKQST